MNCLRRLAAFAIVSAVLALAACEVRSANAAPPPTHAMLVPAASCAADSLCYVLTWPAVSDVNGAADHYHVRITTSAGWLQDDTVTVPSFRFAISKPLAGDSVTITAQVWSIRRSLQSASPATASATAHTIDVAPPAPSTIIITPDTLAAAEISGVHETVYAVGLVTSDSTATVIGGSPTMDWCQPVDVHAGTTYIPAMDTTWVFTLASR